MASFEFLLILVAIIWIFFQTPIEQENENSIVPPYPFSYTDPVFGPDPPPASNEFKVPGLLKIIEYSSQSNQVYIIVDSTQMSLLSSTEKTKIYSLAIPLSIYSIVSDLSKNLFLQIEFSRRGSLTYIRSTFGAGSVLLANSVPVGTAVAFRKANEPKPTTPLKNLVIQYISRIENTGAEDVINIQEVR